jgi:NAD(P)-dependent dehydrogenase (short-subunit alcohol dehydrogenase family)
VKSVLVTGASGGIGTALCAAFQEAGWRVLATDRPGSVPSGRSVFLPLELERFAAEAPVRDAFAAEVRKALDGGSLDALVNNAAVQRLGSTSEATQEDWQLSLSVNVVAPFLLVQAFLPELEKSRGSVVNIASIHATQTKPGFVAYATSKAALAGMTRALAVDLGGRVRVNAIHPAAIGTPMLEAGFDGRPGDRRRLDEFHPAGRIGRPEEVARLAVILASETSGFLTGACIGLDGALSARLHDPV